jgi:hypothetical protein
MELFELQAQKYESSFKYFHAKLYEEIEVQESNKNDLKNRFISKKSGGF